MYGPWQEKEIAAGAKVMQMFFLAFQIKWLVHVKQHIWQLSILAPQATVQSW